MSKEVRVRFAPSPTGHLHIGSLRTALFNFLFAKNQGGKFILRIEDTDQGRLVPGSLEVIVKTLADFGITNDEGPYWDGELKEKGDKGPYEQSKRLDLYHKYTQELVNKKAAYYCFCTPDRLQQLRQSQEAQKLPPKYDKHCLSLTEKEIGEKFVSKEPYVVRLNVPADQKISFDDLVHGHIEIPTNDIDDQVLLKSDGFPTYHLAVVVDDYLMGITHVLRGEEWIPSTPKHILLYNFFGWPAPQFGHLPNILGKSGKKLSKRESDVSVDDFMSKGYLRDALLNFIVFLGWNPKTEQEIFTLEELIAQFDIKKVNKSGAVFDPDKLDWINGLYIRKQTPEQLLELLSPYLKQAGYEIEKYPKEFLEKIVKMEQERLKKLSEIGERVKYFFAEPEYDGKLLIWKKSDQEKTKANLKLLEEFIKQLPQESFSKEKIETALKGFITDNNLTTGDVLWPLRAALTGLDASPGPFEIVDAFGVLPDGKDLIIKRFNQAVLKLS